MSEGGKLHVYTYLPSTCETLASVYANISNVCRDPHHKLGSKDVGAGAAKKKKKKLK